MRRDRARKTRGWRRWLRRLFGDTTGAVFAEAVIMLPFFIIVWGLIIYVHDYYSRRITLGQQSKSCSWQYSNDGCQRMPAGCERFSVRAAGDFSADELPDGGGSALQQFANLPIVRGILTLVLGKNAVVDASAEVAKPGVLGGGRAPMRSRHSVMCNEIPRTPGDIARDAFCRLTHLCGR
jgi:hypothetical protein